MKNTLVSAFVFPLSVISLLALGAGCDSPADKSPYCASPSGAICEPPGFPFVTGVGFRSDACPRGGNCEKPASKTTTELTLPEAGKVCMKGTVAGRDGFAWLIVGLSRWNEAGTHIVDVFDAKALGIRQLKFTLEHPPVTGLTMAATSAWRRDCPAPGECLTGFDLRTGPRSATIKVLDQTETVTAPFTDFTNDDPNLTFDTTQMGHFIFALGAGDYDFCLSGFTFLDASGNVVEGPAEIDAGVMSDATQGS